MNYLVDVIFFIIYQILRFIIGDTGWSQIFLDGQRLAMNHSVDFFNCWFDLERSVK
jgi:hypothetical protein